MASRSNTRRKTWDIVSGVARFGLAAVWIVSGISKIGDPLAVKQSVNAYQLFGPGLVNLIGTALAPVEIALGVLVLLGILLRYMGAISAVMFIAFIAGIASAWARGLTIDCGCFGTGGDNPNVTGATYATEIARDTVFFVLAAIVTFKPFTRWSMPGLSR